MIGSHRVLVASLFLPSGVEFEPINPGPASPSISLSSPRFSISEDGPSENDFSLPARSNPIKPPTSPQPGDTPAPSLGFSRPGIERTVTSGAGSGAQTPFVGMAGAGAGGNGGGVPGVVKPGLSIIDDLQERQQAKSVAPSPAATPFNDSSLNPFFQPTSALPSISQATSLASRALGIDPKSPNPSSSNAAPAETAEGPGSAGSAPAPPAPGLPPHANRDPLKTTTAEGAAVKPNSIPRGAPSEMSHVPSPTSSRPPPVSTASSTGLGVSGGASRPGFTTQKSGFGVGPGGRLPLNTLPHPPPSAVMANYTPSQPASPASASSGGGAGSFPLGGPNANATNASGSLGRSTSRSSSRRRSQSSQANSGGKEQAHPFHLSHNPQGNIGLQNALQAIKGETKDLCWVGALGNRTDGVGKATRSDIESRLWKEQKSKAVWIEDKVFEGHYDVFCKQILWPTFHYSTVRKDETTNWEDYVKVNQAFADKLAETYEEGDIIFVNDYHLLLVPAMVRDKCPNAIIGFFLHIAFPSSEIFRCLAKREELIAGMLGANLVGFQTYNFSRHFRQTVSRVLQHVEATPKGIQLQGWFCDVEVFGIGIDVEALEARRQEAEVQEWAGLLRERYGDTKLIVSRDKLDEVKGLKHKLLSFEVFLQAHPEWQGKVVLIQVALSTTETNESQENVSEIVTRINSRFSTLTYNPVVFLHTEPPTFSQYLGLLTVADAFIATSLREGMNLTAHEFVRCQDKKHAPMILSEFTGSYSYSSFRSCLPVNPWDYRQVSDAIFQALTMPPEEATTRWKELDAHVTDHTAQTWARKYLTHLERAHSNQRSRSPGEIPKLDIATLEADYRSAGERLLLLDLEGTLWNEDPYKTHTEGFHPPSTLIDVLKTVTLDEKTTVYLLSGRGKADLDKIGKQVPRLGLVAEHGCYIKAAGTSDDHNDWVSTVTNLDMSWRPICLEILTYFTERTPGAYIEDRGTSIVWRFSDTGKTEGDELSGEHVWAKRQAAEAQNHVSDVLCERYKLQIYPGRDAFLVLPRQTTRSSAVAAILAPMPAASGSSSNSALSSTLSPNSNTMAPSPSLFSALATPKITPSTSPRPNLPSSMGTTTALAQAHPLPSSLQTSFDLIVALTADERLVAGLNALKIAAASSSEGAKTKVYTVTAGAKNSQAKYACESGKATDLLSGLMGKQ